MDLGDGLLRHPLALYEVFFLMVLFFSLHKIKKLNQLENGMLFKYFMADLLAVIARLRSWMRISDQ